ncbi:hypothetical protein K469DRAFT_695163 [Zopfia rhizophila CBS 207.26]|uniref:Uncharacterized protein n=1 Tax=Zopfia rhizophila CBS 207.26 TaxID=1314779 RepID=A0A6A6DKT2_9PEZI|nr:hypothetical protein K469DRAFT_695163 [Zopfia rhizophila CBS 207.26]
MEPNDERQSFGELIAKLRAVSLRRPAREKDLTFVPESAPPTTLETIPCSTTRSAFPPIRMAGLQSKIKDLALTEATEYERKVKAEKEAYEARVSPAKDAFHKSLKELKELVLLDDFNRETKMLGLADDHYSVKGLARSVSDDCKAAVTKAAEMLREAAPDIGFRIPMVPGSPIQEDPPTPAAPIFEDFPFPEASSVEVTPVLDARIPEDALTRGASIIEEAPTTQATIPGNTAPTQRPTSPSLDFPFTITLMIAPTIVHSPSQKCASITQIWCWARNGSPSCLTSTLRLDWPCPNTVLRDVLRTMTCW